MAGDSGKPGASEAASLVFRIATMGLSLASAIMTAASTQCIRGGTTVSYSDYNSFRYSALADLLSAVLQGVAIYLQVLKKEKAARAVELIDKLLLALTSTSAALLFAIDDITSCGVGERRSSSRVCAQAGRFCGQIRASSFFSLAATASVSVSVYTRHVPLGDILKPKQAAPPVLQISTLTPKDHPPTTGTKPKRDKGKGKLRTEQPPVTPRQPSLPVTPSPPVTPRPPTPPVTPPPPPVTPSPRQPSLPMTPLPPVKRLPPLPSPSPPRPCGGCPRPMITHVGENPAPSPAVMPQPNCGCTRLTIQHGCVVHDRATMIEPEEPCAVDASVPTQQTTQPHEIYSYVLPRLGFYGSS